jgi:hypothetical protein
MRSRSEVLELDRICAKNAHLSADKQVARELWKMAEEYRAEAGKLDSDKLPDLGNPPQGLENLDQSLSNRVDSEANGSA